MRTEDFPFISFHFSKLMTSVSFLFVCLFLPFHFIGDGKKDFFLKFHLQNIINRDKGQKAKVSWKRKLGNWWRVRCEWWCVGFFSTPFLSLCLCIHSNFIFTQRMMNSWSSSHKDFLTIDLTDEEWGTLFIVPGFLLSNWVFINMNK